MKKIVLIGDSVRQGYDKYVKEALKGIADVSYPGENCRFSTYILRNLIIWKRELEWGDDVDLVHWNAGLWDCLVMVDGEKLVPLEVYKENIDRICRQIKMLFPKAKMIFATSTPCIERLFADRDCKRKNSDTEMYNAAACEIVKKHGGEINDLYELMKDVPEAYHSDLTHFYTKEATELMTGKVLSVIENALDIKANVLDYDKYFSIDGEPVGI